MNFIGENIYALSDILMIFGIHTVYIYIQYISDEDGMSHARMVDPLAVHKCTSSYLP